MNSKIKHIVQQLADLDMVGHPEYENIYAQAVAYAEIGASKAQLTRYVEQLVELAPL